MAATIGELLVTMKSKTDEEQSVYVDVISSIASSNDALSQLRSILMRANPAAAGLNNKVIATTASLAAWAADIGTVPYKPSRDQHYHQLEIYCALHGIDYNKILQYRIVGDEIQKWFDDVLADIIIEK